MLHGWLACWLILVLVALVVRPLLPVDETRYIGVGWEMWIHGDFLVPHLNGEVYAHKPPLMFWTINAGWWLFGVNSWWPRLIAPLLALATLFSTRLLARELWSDRKPLRLIAPWVLSGGLYWSLFFTMLMFDLWEALFVTTCALGLLRAASGRRIGGFTLVGISIGLGILAKGPVILLYCLPLALLAPCWRPPQSAALHLRWFGGLLLALLLGIAMALAWALPAAAAGGQAYADAILWGQTVGRVTHSPAHAQPWWWYLPVLPLLLLPWSLWTPLWIGRRTPSDSTPWALRFCVAGCLPSIILLCFSSAKQPHYLLPLMPFVALLISHRVSRSCGNFRRHSIGPGLFWCSLGLVLAMGPWLVARFPEQLGGPPWVSELSPWMGAPVFLAGCWTLGMRTRSILSATASVGLLCPALLLSVHLFGVPAAAPAYDLRPISQRLAEYQAEGTPLAIRRKYQGQFHFLGRLERPMASMELSEVPAWFEHNPSGLFVAIHHNGLPSNCEPEFSQLYRGGWIAIWDRFEVLAHPEVLDDHYVSETSKAE